MTLKEMGKALGISPSTISKVLNGCTKNFTIPDELRARILKHVEECGYSPNPVFQSMRVSKNKQIACFFYSSSPYKAGNTSDLAMNAAISRLEKQKYEVYYQFCMQARQCGYPQPNWKAAGILIPDVLQADQLTALEAKDQIYVSINGLCGAKGTAVQADEIQNMGLALEYLHGLGHKRIVYLYNSSDLDADQPHHYSTTERMSAYSDFQKEHQQRAVSIRGCVEDDHWIQTILDMKPTAVISGDERLGLKLSRAAYESGISIPSDISMILFNDVDYLSSTVPAFTTVRIPADEMGELAGKILAKKIKDPAYDSGVTHRLSGELILRESTAPVKSN